jgi:hypothetical protein
MTNTQPTAQTGALTLVLLAKMYKSQMINLLVKNGVYVTDSASEEQVTSLITNLLKVSKSFSEDLTNFITNPAVANAILGGMEQTAQYYQMSGSGYMNMTDSEDEDYNIFDYYDTDEDPALPAPIKKSKSFFEGFNLPDFLSQSMNLFGQYTKGKSDAEIAKQRADVARAGGGKVKQDDPKVIEDEDPDKEKGLGTVAIVAISLVGVALIGTVIYFIARPKN